MISTAEHERLCRTLLDALEGGAMVCRAGGEVCMHNEDAVRLLGTGGDRTVVNGGDREPMARVLEGASVYDHIRKRVLRPMLRGAAATSSDESFRLILRRPNDRWLRIQVRRVGPSHEEDALLLVHLQSQSLWSTSEASGHQVLRDLIESMRAPLSSIRASIETMMAYPSMEAATTTQFATIIEEQTALLTTQLEAAVEGYATLYRQAWPLIAIAGDDLLRSLEVTVQDALSVPLRTDVAASATRVRARIDISALAQVVQVLATRIVHATRCPFLMLRVETVRQLLAINLEWQGQGMTAARIQKWKDKTLTWGTPRVEMTIQEILDHHDAQIWSQRTDDGTALLRILLPVATSSD